MDLDNLGKCSVINTLGVNSPLQFWTDSWNNQLPLAYQFFTLYEICSNKTITLKEVIYSQGAAVHFMR